MKIDIPNLDQFALQAVDEVRFNGTNQELHYSVEVEPHSITNRIAVALMDSNNRVGMAVAIYPATGEVCDIVNGGGVIGYLSHAPLHPNQPIICELSVFRFGRNFVCNASINEETFLYPAFSYDASAPMAALVGKERHNGDNRFSWDHLRVELQELDAGIAA